MNVLFRLALLVGATLLIGGVAVIETPEAVKVSALAGLLRLSPDEEIYIDAIGTLLISAGLMAITSAACRCFYLPSRLLLLIPAQLILAVQAWSISHAVFAGEYPDGYVPGGGQCLLLGNVGSCFILADQAVTLAVIIAFTIEFASAVVRPEAYQA